MSVRYRRAAKSDRTDADGTVFDSRGEMRRWYELRLLERTGQISMLERQVQFPIVINRKQLALRSTRFHKKGRPVVYIADFVYIDKNGEKIIEEFKGVWNDAARLKVALVEQLYGIEVTITGQGKRI
jgi:hypothetical protein